MRFLFLLPITLCVFFYAKGQCPLPVPLPNLTCGSGTLLQNDFTGINSGQTYYYNGSGATISGVQLNGGTLIICGTLTLSNFSHNAGTIYVAADGNVSFDGNFNVGGDVNYFNLGATTFNVSTVAIQGANSFVYNAPGAIITVNALSIFNDGKFINEGTAIGQNILFNTNGSVCLGPQSISNTVSVNVQSGAGTPPVTVPSGKACISYSSSFTGVGPITSTSNLKVCQLPGASNPDPVALGAAEASQNCSSCAAVLPVKLILFRGNELNGQVTLQWETSFEENVKSFIIESSNDGRRFESIGEIAAHNTPSVYHFNTIITGKTFFRLKMLDIDGVFTYSPVLVLFPNMTGKQWKILSNPVTSFVELSVNALKKQNAEVVITDNIGRILKRVPVALLKGNNFIRINTGSFAAGLYHLLLNRIDAGFKTLSFIKVQ